VQIEQIMTFGDVRRIIIDTVIQVRDGRMGSTQGMTIAALMKSLTDNVQVEINAAKLAIATEDKAHNFGRVVGMGQRLIGNDGQQSA
jgi:hypothetical protein